MEPRRPTTGLRWKTACGGGLVLHGCAVHILYHVDAHHYTAAQLLQQACMCTACWHWAQCLLECWHASREVLSYFAGVANSEALKGFDWLVDEVEKMGGIKLMMTLTNCCNDYGGMQQYVR